MIRRSVDANTIKIDLTALVWFGCRVAVARARLVDDWLLRFQLHVGEEIKIVRSECHQDRGNCTGEL